VIAQVYFKDHAHCLVDSLLGGVAKWVLMGDSLVCRRNFSLDFPSPQRVNAKFTTHGDLTWRWSC